MELIDTHAHLTFDELEKDVDEVVGRSRAAGVTGWITVGTEPQQNRKVTALVPKFENMYAAVGIHPHYAQNFTPDDVEQLKQFAQSEKVVAIGETGFDFHYKGFSKVLQKKLFREELKIAQELNLPVIVHCREAFDETMGLLNEFTGKLKNVVVHCFGGSIEQAKMILDKGFYISFTGTVTFKKAEAVRQTAKFVPLERLMVETDCPFISPEPMRKQKVNEPALMVHTARCLAELKAMEPEAFAEAVTRTSKTFFGLP